MTVCKINDEFLTINVIIIQFLLFFFNIPMKISSVKYIFFVVC